LIGKSMGQLLTRAKAPPGGLPRTLTREVRTMPKQDDGFSSIGGKLPVEAAGEYHRRDIRAGTTDSMVRAMVRETKKAPEFPLGLGHDTVCLTMKPVGERSSGNPHAAFDERGWETGRLPNGSKLPRPSPTSRLRTIRQRCVDTCLPVPPRSWRRAGSKYRIDLRIRRHRSAPLVADISGGSERLPLPCCALGSRRKLTCSLFVL